MDKLSKSVIIIVIVLSIVILGLLFNPPVNAAVHEKSLILIL